MSFDNFESNMMVIASGNGSEKETNEITMKEIGDRLEKGEWLWSPYLVDKIKTASEGRKVVVVDVDGILRSNLSEDDENPEAENVLKKLKEKGYMVVIWTSANRKWLKEKSQKFVDLADFAIANENYSDRERFGEDKKQLRDLIRDYGSYSEEERSVNIRETRQRKWAELLFDKAVLLEDGGIFGKQGSRSEIRGHRVNVLVNDRQRSNYFAHIDLASFSGKMSEWEKNNCLGEWVADTVDKIFGDVE